MQMKTLAKIVLFFCFTIPFYLNANAQKPITWQRLYGDSNHDVGYSVDTTFDGGYIFSGVSYTGQLCRVVRTNSYGDVIWNRYYGGDIYEDIAQTADSCFILTGFAQGLTGSGSDGYILKINPVGEIIWWKKFGGKNDDYFHDVYITKKNEMIFIGTYESDNSIRNMYLVKTDFNGNEIWSRIYDSTGSGFNVDEIPGRGYLLSGSSEIYADLSGNMKYSKRALGINGLNSINDNGFIFFDNKDSNGINAIKIVKTDSMFNTIWMNWIYNPQRLLFGFDIIKDKHSYVIGGSNLSFQGDEDAYIIKIDTIGSKIWDRIIPPRFEFNEGIYSINKCNDSGFIALGFSSTFFSSTESDFLAVKTDKNGNTVPISVESNNEIIKEDYNLFQNYPNPFNSVTIIRYTLFKSAFVNLSVYDINGKLIDVMKNNFESSGEYEIQFKSNNLPSGIYLYSMIVFDTQHYFKKQIVKKLILIK